MWPLCAERHAGAAHSPNVELAKRLERPRASSNVSDAPTQTDVVVCKAGLPKRTERGERIEEF